MRGLMDFFSSSDLKPLFKVPSFGIRCDQAHNFELSMTHLIFLEFGKEGLS